MSRSLEALVALFEVCCLLALACLGLVLLPVFCLIEIFRGNGLWFINPPGGVQRKRGR